MNATFPTSPPFPLGPELSPSKRSCHGSGRGGDSSPTGAHARSGVPKNLPLPQPLRGGEVQAKAVLKTVPSGPQHDPRLPQRSRHPPTQALSNSRCEGTLPTFKTARAAPAQLQTTGWREGHNKPYPSFLLFSPPLAFPVLAIPSYYQMGMP